MSVVTIENSAEPASAAWAIHSLASRAARALPPAVRRGRKRTILRFSIAMLITRRLARPLGDMPRESIFHRQSRSARFWRTGAAARLRLFDGQIHDGSQILVFTQLAAE